ncbi:MAG: adenylate/guanylate cyclase domain-containing protein [Hyphomicrobium sp.]|nr:adenylate/guanylate cyclase domain-containing protein [Hyphomicrobium sp.]
MPRQLPLHVLIALAILALAVIVRVADPGPVARLRLSVFDAYLTANPRVPDPAFPVKIVDIDEASLAQFGQWPWPRTRLAEIVDRLRALGARAVAVDLVLAEPDRMSPAALAETLPNEPELRPLAEAVARLPSNDARLAESIATLPVVLGFSAEAGAARQLPPPKAPFALAGDDPKTFVPRFEGGTGPLPELAARAAGLGAVNWLPERDQIVRSVPLLVGAGGALYPSLSLETLRVLDGPGATIVVKSSNASGLTAFGAASGIEIVRAGGHVLPSDGRGELWLNFAPHDDRRMISARRVLAGDVESREIEGRIVLIGASATGLLDLRATPLAASVPGVEIHAQALEQMLSGRHLVRPAWATGAELFFMLAAAGLVAWLIGYAGAAVAAVASAAAIVAVALSSWLLFVGAGYLIDAVYPALTLAAVYVTGSLASYVKSETDRLRISAAFGHYLAPAVVAELARDPDKLKLGGETRELTLLFADVRGFSKMSEGMEATELVGFVNRLFTPLADAILARRGTIDKFMGDAVMAFWNAPLADAGHASEACRAALDMQRAIAAMNANRTEGAPPVRIGIGLNTGSCVVGNVGSPARFDYSVLGDSVNTASRIEEMTKIFGLPIIVGEATRDEAGPGFAFVEIGAVALRGKDRPAKLYALLGDAELLEHPAMPQLAPAVAAYAAAMANGEAASAAAHLAKIDQADNIISAAVAPIKAASG